MTTQTTQLAGVLIALVSLVTGLLVGAYQRYLQIKLARFSALQELHRQIGVPEFRLALRRVLQATDEEIDRVDELGPAELREALEAVSSVYDLMGARLEDGILPKEGTLKTEWKILAVLWPKLRPFVEKRAKGRNTPYKQHLRWLADRAAKYQVKHFPKDIPIINHHELRDVAEDRGAAEGLRHHHDTILCQGKWLQLCLTSDGWEYVQRRRGKGGVVILPVTPEGNVVLIEQRRDPFHSVVIELPSGLVADEPGEINERVVDAAVRELEEETGYRSSSVEELVRGPFLPGLTNEENSICLVTSSVRSSSFVAPLGTVVHEVSANQVWPWLKDKAAAGVTIDLRIYAALYFLAQHRTLKFYEGHGDAS